MKAEGAKLETGSFKNSLINVLKFPLTILQYAGKGITYLKNVITKDFSVDYDPNRLEGEALEDELKKIQAQSSNFQKAIKKNKKEKEYSFRYEVKNDYGDIIKGTFEAPTLEDVKVFLENEYPEVLKISPRSKFDIDVNLRKKIKTEDLAFFLTQLATYIRAGIPLIDAMRILVKQTDDQLKKRLFQKLVYHLVGGETFSYALEAQNGAFPKFLVSMVKTAEMTGDLPGVLDEVADYYTKMSRNAKQMKSAMIYPSAIALVALIAVVFLVTFVVPQFVDMFAQVDGKLPGITLFVMWLSNTLITKGWIILIVVILFVSALIYFYKNNKKFRYNIQKLEMKLPVIGNIIIYNEVSKLTRTFATLLNHGVFITDSMEILSAITDNEIYKDIIYRTLIGLSKGAKISETFKGEWAFPVVAYEMLVTGESTGQLALMMEKVAEHFSSLHETSVNTLKSLMEPAIIIILAVVVGFILLSVIIPMFAMYQAL